MLRCKSWLLIGLLSASCVVPDVEVVDGGDDDDTPSAGGKSSTGGKGSSAGGTSGDEEGGDTSGPSGGTTSNPGTAGTGAVPSPPGAAAFGKFCNNITVDGESITLSLSVGAGSKRVQFSADSGECTPISGDACDSLPVGTGIPLTLLADNETIVTYTVDIADGDYWIFLAWTDGTNVAVASDPVDQDTCEAGYDAPAGG